MIQSSMPNKSSCLKFVFSFLCFLFYLLATHTSLFAQPVNNDCNNASVVTIGSGGFGLGLFTSANTDITSATLQTGETFAPSITVAGLTKKSVWYKFTLPTTRSVRVSLLQPGSAIQAGNVGFAVYKTNTCIPGNTEISTKLSPIETFGSTFHPCVADGDYYVQVTSNNSANGSIFLTVELADGSPAPYDKPATAYQFGDLTPNQQVFKDADIDCQSIDDATEVCLPSTSFKDYTKSIWYTFKTPAYFDYLNTWFASTTTPYYSAAIKVGYRIYKGDPTNTPVTSLTQIGGCDSLITDLYAIGKKEYKCGALLSNTTYTVQLLFHKDFKNSIRFGADWKGDKPTNGPLPINTLATPNKMGTLSANSNTGGAINTISDVFGCNSQHSQNSCPKSMPPAGVSYSGYNFNLSSFISFNLASTSSIFFSAQTISCSGTLLCRLYKQDLTSICTDLDTNNIISTFWYNTYQSNPLSCLAAGNYVLQVMAVDSTRGKNTYSAGSLGTSAANYLCMNFGLGSTYTLNLYVRTEVASNKFDLSATGRFDKLNANGAGIMQPLVTGTKYNSAVDTFGCANTVMPADTICWPSYYYGIATKASYREFVLADSADLYFENYYAANSKLYFGDADALVTAQNKYLFPERFTGLTPSSKCFEQFNSGVSKYACAIPGTYTFVSYDSRLSQESRMSITPLVSKSKYGTPSTAQDMGDLWSYIPTNTWYQSGVDTFTCRDNPATIDGLDPCNSQQGVPGTKLIYRQFYLSKPTILSIYNYIGYGGEPYGYGVFTMFKGKATDGINTLVKYSDAWTCFTRAGSNGQCDAIPAGWYTVVSYGSGPNFSNPTGGMSNGNNYQYNSIGYTDKFMILLGQACATPQFNRPFKASVDTLTNQPYKIEWSPQTGHTADFPLLSKTYTLNKENFDCTQDTAFIRQRVNNCSIADAKVAFYVFTTTQEAYVKINIPDGNIWGSVYGFDVRTGDSLRLKNGKDTALQPCINKPNQIDFCRLQPGTYTLVIFAPASYTCNNITPTIFIDSVGISRFDHAVRAYDFGAIQPDSIWHNGKAGDVNPYSTGRAASNDFFYCTTGAQLNDPINGQGCYTQYNPNIYPSSPNQVVHPGNTPWSYQDRRTLWHTFTVNYPGTIRVKVNGRRGTQSVQPNFAVYSSNEDGSLPFATLQSNGLVDSTLLQGLEYKVNNIYYCPYAGYNQVSFYKDPCTFKPTRYYIVTDNFYTDNVNFQVEVEVLLDSANTNPPKFDHFSQANDMGLVNSGIKKGAVDNFTCATKDLPDPLYAYTNCQKTLWYKFTTTVTGTIRYAAFFKNTNNWYYDHIQLFRQIKPNDSSSTGLLHLPYTTNYFNDGYWAQQCISPGTYYIILPGCNAVNEDVYPQIEIIPAAGDFCSTPMVAGLNGPGTTVVPVTVDCHTIGTDYGEFNPTLTCPANALTKDYKSSWYRLDITGTDTLDVTVYINEKTNASSTDIKYRLMTGNCGAMQEQSCVQDALTRNTYKCFAPGNSYYIQVFSPVIINGYQQVTGDIDLNIEAVKHADTCLPAATCIAVANFTPQFDCTKDKNVIFTNFSTYGSSIQYKWDFGYNNQTSTEVSPQFFYPALTTAQTYTATLIITNSSCGKKDSVTQNIVIPARPAVNLGRDTIICANGSTFNLDATSHNGSTYYWYNGSTQPTITLSGLNYNAWVEVTYGTCKTRDSINVFINPITKRSLQTKALCAVTQVTLDANRGQGELYQWNTGVFTSSITVTQPGIYWVDIYWNGCIVRDSFQVVSSSLRPLGNDRSVCQAVIPYTIDATVSGATGYTWQDNSTSATFTVTKTGLYWVDISLSGCTFRDTLNIAVDSFKTVNTSVQICEGQSYILPSGLRVNIAGIYQDTTRSTVSGCDSIIKVITLTVNSKPNLGADKNISICAGNTLNLTTQFATTSLSTDWTIGGAMVDNPAGVSQAGLYRLIATNGAGCADTAFVTLTVNTKPDIGIDKSTSICPGFNFNLTTQFVTTGLTNSWTLSGINVNSPTAVTAAGTYQLISTNGTGCSDTALVNLSVNPKPALGSDKTVNICPGFSTNLTIQFSSNGLMESWSLSGAAIGSPTNVTAAGIYQLIAANGFGCTDTAFVTVTVNAKPSLANDTAVAICSGNAINLTALYTTTGLSNNWTTSGSAVANPAAVNTAGTYQLIATNASGCSDTALVKLTINPKPVLAADKSISICPGFSADLTTQYNTNGLTTNWTIAGATVSNPMAVTAAGNYRLIVTNNFGCTDTAFVTVNLSAKPALGIDKSVNICAGFNTDLTTQFTTTGLASNWSLNNAAIASPTAITTAGVYQLIANNATSCSDTVLVTVSISPKPDLGVDKTATACSRNSINLNNQFTSTGLNAVWTSGGVVVSNPAAVTVSGNYQLVASNASGCSDTAFCNVTIFAKPFVGRDTSINICPGSSFNLTAQYPVTGLSISWTRGGVTVTNPSAINQPGMYQLIGTNSNNCLDTALFTLTIEPNPTVLITNPANLCEPQTANLTLASVTAGSSPNLTFSYFKDTTALSVFETPLAAPNGTYFIKGTNATGCFDIKKVLVFVYPMPVVRAGADTAICENTTATLHVAVTNILAPVLYQWEPAATVQNSTANNSIASPAATTIYKVTVKDTYGCNFNVVDEVKVTVQPPVNAFAGNDTTATVWVPHQLTATGGVQYLWSPASPLNNPFISNPLAVLNMDTRFAVEVTDAIGCVGYDTILVKVYEGITYYMPNAFSPNGDGINDVFKPTPVGIVSTSYFRIFNRYGTIVFETNQWNKGWDGTYKGIAQQIGNYVWVIKGTGRDGKIIEMRGNVVLLR